MNEWADWYSRVLGFKRYISFDDKDISTEYSALMSIVMSDDSHAIKFPLNEPAQGRRKSQIEEYLDYYRRDFHPWDHDNRWKIAQYVEGYRNKELRAA